MMRILCTIFTIAICTEIAANELNSYFCTPLVYGDGSESELVFFEIVDEHPFCDGKCAILTGEFKDFYSLRETSSYWIFTDIMHALFVSVANSMKGFEYRDENDMIDLLLVHPYATANATCKPVQF